MRLDGSCSCGAVKFRLESQTPQPFMRCYCSICRKTAGTGGYAINIMGDAKTLKIRGAKNVAVWRARVAEEPGARPTRSHAHRHFCAKCGSALWIFDPRWPDWVYPHAGAIDTPLPMPRETVEMMTGSAAPWVEVPGGPGHVQFAGYPTESIVDWHAKRGLSVA